ncbi:MAG TPA: Sec-independent protein translocase subunit TatA [Actinomycetes bacterium]|nr:Sec-independent protein translocase subunit TatA [Actinomycetes bacterium]
MANFRGWEILVILALILLLFGAKRMPDAARGLGRSLRIFKSEIKASQEDDEATPKPIDQITATPDDVVTPTKPVNEPESTER